MNQPFNPAYAAPAYGYGAPSYGMASYGYPGTTVFGANPDGTPTTGEKITKFLDDKTGPLQNKFWLGGAIVGGGLWYYMATRRGRR